VRNVSIIWRRLDLPDTQDHRVILFDDGMMGGDRVFGDGLFTGVLEPGLPEGAAIQFYIECTDLSGQVTTSPSDPTFAAAGQPVTLTTLALSSVRPGLELSEVVADNQNGLRDETGGRPDWVEIRNTSTAPVSLAGLQLAGRFFGNGSRFLLPTRVLAPGEHLVFYADGKTNQGPSHLPFNLKREGDEVWLTGSATNGARARVDSVKFGGQTSDVAWARLGANGPWRPTRPTPTAPNLASSWDGLVSANGTFTFGYATQPGFRFTVEYTDAIESAVWNELAPVPGTGVEQSITEPLNAKRFYRVRREP
jgi:hypothetical protein